MPLPPRLDLVPINRSVGLKAKPTKPVTEVLRPVVAKYGLHLSELVARLVSNLGPGWEKLQWTAVGGPLRLCPPHQAGAVGCTSAHTSAPLSGNACVCLHLTHYWRDLA